MTREELEKAVRQQIERRKPPKHPDNHTIQTAMTLCCEDLDIPSAPHCAAVAIRLAHAYRQEPRDTGQPMTPPQEKQVVNDAEERVNALIGKFRDRLLGTGAAYCWPPEEAQAYLAMPSAGDTLVPFCQDMASATKTTVSAVAMAVLARQQLALSAGNISTVTYSVRISEDDTETEMLQWATVELLTGNLPTHMVRDHWLPRMRQATGHRPRQHTRTQDEQERDSELRTFVAAQKQESKCFRGRAPNGFRASTLQAWNAQCELRGRLQWLFPTKEALFMAYRRLESPMPQDATEEGLDEGNNPHGDMPME